MLQRFGIYHQGREDAGKNMYKGWIKWPKYCTYFNLQGFEDSNYIIAKVPLCS